LVACVRTHEFFPLLKIFLFHSVFRKTHDRLVDFLVCHGATEMGIPAAEYGIEHASYD